MLDEWTIRASHTRKAQEPWIRQGIEADLSLPASRSSADGCRRGGGIRAFADVQLQRALCYKGEYDRPYLV
jgi:hypothetical protein